ncbi:MAG TPA: bifunctional [glutamine synthetase] adenylyltransferase/[glutamine synthetase]-adenylyl-L-tyrosine phosphorylase [Candidatus Stackebrandtia excrementipullorum]|nr:bifunctional [glutamine synthetase] adenylyltransferase/[glutamine synthetase]-adenylyl-L-tyrosine phosphorylase [Candidatus Stackebrandtia excrementipullorum]
MSALSRRQLTRLLEADAEARTVMAEDAQLDKRIKAVLAASEALGDHLIAHPGSWRYLTHDHLDLTELDEAAGVAALRAAYRGQLLRICALDLVSGLDVLDVSHRLSDLADATLRAAVRIARTEQPCDGDTRLAVIAMGKCGARELNYVSDVDVLFVADGNLTVATQWAVRMMSICAAVAWPVDAGLRPEGRSGALVRTIDSYLAYYRRWAHTWEFQALVKARPAAGDALLGNGWMDKVSPLVWDTADTGEVLNEIRAMRRRVVAELPGDDAEREIKLGRGGLRDIEFAVQLLQLVHGRSDPALRVTGTLEALDALIGGGYLARRDGESLHETYRWLRVVEHRLQLQKLRRTHSIPADPEPLHWLARGLGYRDTEGFNRDWRRYAGTARRLHEKLFYRPLLDAVAEVPSQGLRLTPDAARTRLEALGFADPEKALRHISTLISGVSRTAAIQRTLLPVLLGEFADAPEPDRGLLAYRKVSERLGRTDWYLRVMRDGGPTSLRLARILATSRYITDLLLRDPAAFRLLSDDGHLRPRDLEDLKEGMAAAAARHTEPDKAVSAVRSIRRRELLRIACADILGHLDIVETGHALSDVADAVIDTVLGIAARAQGCAAKITVIGMGRLGGRETSYASDADVLFVHDGDKTEEAVAAIELMRRLLSIPAHEPAMRLDVDLRPEGRQGPLIRSVEAYRRYYERWSRPWEGQALVRARHVAGDLGVAERFIELIAPIRYPAGGLDAKQLIELRRVKARVDTERLPRGADRYRHVKLGPGGLTDVEWAVQMLQLQHADAIPALRTTSTLSALAAAVEAGLIAGDDAAELRQAWINASRARDALTLAAGKPSDQLPGPGRDLSLMLAVLREDDEPGSFLDSYLRTARHAHQISERVFYGE